MYVSKGTVKRATKTCNVSCNIAAKQVEERCCAFYHPHQTCRATNQIVACCKKLLRKVESSSTFCNKTCTCCAFYWPRGPFLESPDYFSGPENLIPYPKIANILDFCIFILLVYIYILFAFLFVQTQLNLLSKMPSQRKCMTWNWQHRYKEQEHALFCRFSTIDFIQCEFTAMAVRVHYHMTRFCPTPSTRHAMARECEKKSQKNGWMALFLDESYMCQNFRALLK